MRIRLNMQMNRRAAFTLVELLVVVGIIAVLIALLMPTVVKARQQAMTVKCAANLHSIGHALTMYTQQYGYYPCCLISDTGGSFAIWPHRLRAFTGGNQGVFDCPAEDARCEWKKENAGAAPPATAVHARYGYEEGEPLLDYGGAYFSYGYNVWGTGEQINLPPAQQRGLGVEINLDNPALDPYSGQVRASRVKVPSEMIAIADASVDGWVDVYIAPVSDFRSYQNKSGWPGKIHNGGANVLFCDGHVKWYLQADLVNLDYGSPAGLLMRRMWNNDNQP